MQFCFLLLFPELPAAIVNTYYLSAYPDQNPDFYMDVLKNKYKYQTVVVDTYWNPGSDNGRPELFTPAFRLDLFYPFDYLFKNHRKTISSFPNKATNRLFQTFQGFYHVNLL